MSRETPTLDALINYKELSREYWALIDERKEAERVWAEYSNQMLAILREEGADDEKTHARITKLGVSDKFDEAGKNLDRIRAKLKELHPIVTAALSNLSEADRERLREERVAEKKEPE